jgi:malonyl-CoA/methylmalonyl-CoA synthetase
MLAAQITSLVEAWEWTADDHILHVLPLHHVHGIVNVLCCPLWVGATCEILRKFDTGAVLEHLTKNEKLTLFMAVPTVYARLIAAWEAADSATRKALTDGCRRLRLMVSGSAALPVATLEKWRSISGHTLLERYGMTEIGMGLSNPLHGERVPGSVGSPLPGVEARLVDDAGTPIGDGVPGQIHVRGPGVFTEYWGRPDATADAFTSDGWFKTGDVAVREKGIYRILGRDSVDIIKSGGYKISALEIEEVLRTHESIQDCAVVGVEDAEWGQRVGVAAILKPEAALDLESLRAWAKQRLAVYKVPTLLSLVGDLPRNPMGKVLKPEVVKLFAPEAVAR